MRSAALTMTPYVGWPKQDRSTELQADSILTKSMGEFIPNIVALGSDLQNFILLKRVDKDLFDQHYKKWKEDSYFDSLPMHMKSHESYQLIVAMGQKAIPKIAAELRKEPSFLFLALEDITGEDPVPDVNQGNLPATVEAWLAWLRK